LNPQHGLLGPERPRAGRDRGKRSGRTGFAEHVIKETDDVERVLTSVLVAVRFRELGRGGRGARAEDDLHEPHQIARVDQAVAVHITRLAFDVNDGPLRADRNRLPQGIGHDDVRERQYRRIVFHRVRFDGHDQVEDRTFPRREGNSRSGVEHDMRACVVGEGSRKGRGP